MRLGAHMSIAGSLDEAFDRAVEKRCNTFQIFTRNPRSWKFKDLTREDVDRFRYKAATFEVEPIVVHMPYLPNLASPKEKIYRLSVESLLIELIRCELLEIPYLVTHLGSHLGSGKEAGFERIVKGINWAISEVESNTMLLLETTADTKNSMGGSFEDIRFIINRLNEIDRIGVCFDTCHVYTAGYDLRNYEVQIKTMEKFEKVIGLERIKVIHVSDAKGELGSKLDRHEHIGMGYIGDEGFKALLRHQVLGELPLILETPIDKRGDDYTDLEKMREIFKSIHRRTD